MRTAPTKLLIAAATLTLAACGSSKPDSSEKGGGGGGGKPKAAAAPKAKVRDTSTAKGAFPATLASADIENPAAIKVRVTPTPARRTSVSWTVACRRGRRAGTKGGRFTVTDAATRTLKAPLKRSEACHVSASAQMSKKGTLKVQILG